ncbi:hypothetical protein CAL28_10645 [Bordetella genomosp. 11]|uniref:Uncharacterized protein n=2 Tax=Bordetella genomosp. 11 TaxID=1416808 RepID=A0A261UDD9_9BORD|nr:hypothetical protein CAL28_10645 [Bordetella genomosp. 11]
MQEPSIEINGQKLTPAQSAVVRVAVTQFQSDIQANPEAFGGDEHGVAMAEAYMARSAEVLLLLLTAD